MARVNTALSVSVDGFVAGPDDGPEFPLGRGGTRLFDWYTDGDTPSEDFPNFRLSPPSARFFDEGCARCGAIVTGRRTYDIAGAWGGSGPLPGRPLFVLTHRIPEDVPAGDPPYTFVTDGIESAIKQAAAAAGEREVTLMGSTPVQQALCAGLLDEINLHVVPVLLGGGVRLLDHLGGRHDLDRLEVVDAPGVTHLRYAVRK